MGEGEGDALLANSSQGLPGSSHGLEESSRVTRNTSHGSDEITSQMWMVLFVSYLGWMLDSMDVTLFLLVQTVCLEDLLEDPSRDQVALTAGYILSAYLIGAALGGVFIGVFCDMFGRALMMMVTILIYSLGSFLSAFVTNWWQLLFLRFVVGIGTGGEWGTGASLVSEVWPDKYRCKVGPLLQCGGASGYLLAGLVFYAFEGYGWRSVFLVGLAPAVIALSLRCFIDESQMWERAGKTQEDGMWTSLSGIFSKKHIVNTISVSVMVSVSVLLYFTVAAWVPAIVTDVARTIEPGEWDERAVGSMAAVFLNIGGILGALSWIYLGQHHGRKVVIAGFLAMQMVVVPITFGLSGSVTVMLCLLPAVGFCASGVFGGFPVYFPELYPTRLRGTGISFCYNIGRAAAALGPLLMGYLVGVFGNYSTPAAVMPLFGVLGIIALLFPSETSTLEE